MKRSLTLKRLTLVLVTAALGVLASGCASSPTASYGGYPADPTKTSLPGTRAYPTLKADAFGGVSVN